MVGEEMMVTEGDPVHLLAVVGSRRRSYYVWARSGSIYHTIAGVVRGSRLVGAPWGSVIKTRIGRIYVLRPSLVDLMEGFYKRATQVIYPKDLGFIQLLAGLRRGMTVAEAGMGSGFLTTVLALAVCPGGRVYTMDVKRDNIGDAMRNLALAGVPEGCVEPIEGDIRVDKIPATVDAVFLDMPDPWAALGNVYNSLRPTGILVAFVPTFNQVDRLVASLDPDKWVLTYAGELIEREVEAVPGAVRPGVRMIGFTGFIVAARRVSGSQ